MFKFIKEIIGSIKEGIQEGLEEAEAEKQEKQNLCDEKMGLIKSQENPTLENVILALSCPFREILTDGSDARLFLFGQLDEKETQDFKKILYRDFAISDWHSLMEALKLDSVRENLSVPEESGKNTALLTFVSSITLYMISGAIDVGYVSYDDYKELCKYHVQTLTQQECFGSWNDFAAAFMEGECINNALGKKYLKAAIGRLLEKENSPWLVFPWDKIKNFTDEAPVCHIDTDSLA